MSNNVTKKCNEAAQHSDLLKILADDNGDVFEFVAINPQAVVENCVEEVRLPGTADQAMAKLDSAPDAVKQMVKDIWFKNSSGEKGGGRGNFAIVSTLIKAELNRCLAINGETPVLWDKNRRFNGDYTGFTVFKFSDHKVDPSVQARQDEFAARRRAQTTGGIAGAGPSRRYNFNG